MMLDDLMVRGDERGVIVGATGAGKSTLADAMILRRREVEPSTIMTIVDVKPRYQPSHDLRGLPAGLRYRRNRHMQHIPFSVLLPAGSGHADYQRAIKSATYIAGPDRAPVIVAQGTLHDAAWYAWVIGEQFRFASKSHIAACYVDELLVLAREGRRHLTTYVQAMIAGREAGVSMTASTQRPRWVPVECLSEATRLYIFRLEVADDVKRLEDSGYPESYGMPEEDRVFAFWHRTRRAGLPRATISV